MMYLKTLDEIKLIKESSQLVSKTLGMLAKEIYPGVNTLYLDHLAEEFIRDYGGIPAFLGLYGFPNTLCVSPNEQVVHGVPNKKPLNNGDIISIDCGVLMNGYYGDNAYTFEVGEVNSQIRNFLQVSKESLYIGISYLKYGNHIGDIGYNIQKYANTNGYSVVIDFVGHGIGSKLHEYPYIPNYGNNGEGKKNEEGLVIAVETMINQGTHKVRFNKNGWTVKTMDKKLSSHFEHNVALFKGCPILLSTFKYIYKVIGISTDEELNFDPNKYGI